MTLEIRAEARGENVRRQAHEVWSNPDTDRPRALLDFAVETGGLALGVSSAFAERIQLSSSLVDFTRDHQGLNDPRPRLWFHFDMEALSQQERQAMADSIQSLSLGDIDRTLAKETAQIIFEVMEVTPATQNQYDYYFENLVYEIMGRNVALKYAASELRRDKHGAKRLQAELGYLVRLSDRRITGAAIQKVIGEF